jgi:hypothetical protein
MMRPTKTRVSLLHAAALLVGLSSLGLARTAQASPDFPPYLKDALDKEFPMIVHCVPLCTACHNTTQGGPGNLNSFGVTLESSQIGLMQGNTDPAHDLALVESAIHNLVTLDPTSDSDHDGTSDIDELNAGDSPSIAGPAGVGQFCPDIRYGCGARIAAAPPVDRFSLLTGGLVAFGLVMARRRRSKARARRARR